MNLLSDYSQFDFETFGLDALFTLPELCSNKRFKKNDEPLNIEKLRVIAALFSTMVSYLDARTTSSFLEVSSTYYKSINACYNVNRGALQLVRYCNKSIPQNNILWKRHLTHFFNNEAFDEQRKFWKPLPLNSQVIINWLNSEQCGVDSLRLCFDDEGPEWDILPILAGRVVEMVCRKPALKNINLFKRITSLELCGKPENLENLNDLEKLEELEFDSLPIFNNLKHNQVTKLVFTGCWFPEDDCLAPIFYSFPKLVEVSFYQCSLVDSDLNNIAHKKIKKVNFRSTQISDLGLKHILCLTQLEILNCSETFITDIGLKTIQEMQNLRELDVSACDRITKLGIEHLAGLPKLTSLNICSIPNIELNDLICLAGLTQLRVRGVDKNINDDFSPSEHFFNFSL